MLNIFRKKDNRKLEKVSADLEKVKIELESLKSLVTMSVTNATMTKKEKRYSTYSVPKEQLKEIEKISQERKE